MTRSAMTSSQVAPRAGRARVWALALGAALLSFAIAGGPAGTTALANSPSPEPARVALPSLAEHKLANGLTVYVMERRHVPVAQVSLVVPAGALHDPEGAPGLAALTAELTRGGTTAHTPEELSAAFDEMGASVAASADLESAHIDVVSLSSQLGDVLPLLAEMAIAPTFPEGEFALRQSEMLAGVKQRADLPSVLAEAHAQAFYYGADHPLGQVPNEATVQSMTVEDVRAFYEAHWRPAGASLLIIGDVDTEQAMRLAGRYLGAWEGRDEAAVRLDVPTPPAVSLDESRVRFVAKPGMTQVQIRLIQPGVALGDERRLPASVANYTLGGGGFASRLMKEIRSESGQTYGISSGLESYSFDGTWSIRTFTRSEQLFETLAGIERVLGAFAEEGITETELQAAKNQLIGSYPMAYETLGGLATQVQEAIRRGRDMEYLAARAFDYDKVTLGEVNDAIRALLEPSVWSVVLVGDPAVFNDAPDTVFGVPVGDIERISWTESVAAYDGEQ